MNPTDVGIVHLYFGKNNIIATLSKLDGKPLAWSSCGSLGFSGVKKTTIYAARRLSKQILTATTANGISTIQIWVRGFGIARAAALRSLRSKEVAVTLVRDVTPSAFGGCRLRKPRRL